MIGPVETLRIGMIAGSAERLLLIHSALRRQEQMGWFDIIRMDDAVAVIRYRDPKIMMLFCETAGVS